MADSITVLIPTPLRPQAGGNASVDVQGATVGEALGALTQQYPDLGNRLYKNAGGDGGSSGGEGASGGVGELNRFINFYVNDEDIRFLQNLDTPVKGGDELSIVPAIAGG